MASTNKGYDWYFAMKAHAGVDLDPSATAMGSAFVASLSQNGI
jgi:hypothetical protein